MRRLGCLVLARDRRGRTRGRCTRMRRVISLAPLRIERVTETIAEEGEAQHRQTDGQYGEEKHVRIGLDIPRIAPFGDHLAPTRLRRSDANTDVTQRRFDEDRGRNAKRQCHDDRREAVREHVLANDVDPATRDLCGADVLLLPQ